MSQFADVYAAADALAKVLPARSPDLLFAVMPNGAPVAASIAQARGCSIRPLYFDRATGEVLAECTGISPAAEIWVADDGVESGTAARAIGQFLKAEGFHIAHLVVPVCARDAIAELQFLYTSVITHTSPLMTRSLKWHYQQLPDLDRATAEALIAPHL